MGNRPCPTCGSVTWFFRDEERCNRCDHELRVNAQVLDHGYVKLIETWGCDERIIEAARMSTDKGFKGWKNDDVWRCPECKYTVTSSLVGGATKIACPNTTHPPIELVFEAAPPGDEKLLRYLYEHKHMTPFEFGGLTIEVQAPIFVFREWHRHRTQSYNEMSARYTPLPDVNYIPTIERIMMSGGSNKQAQSTGSTIDEAGARDFQEALEQQYKAADALYRVSLGAAGVPKELARLCIPVGRYSRMRASANLRNWLGFLTLRMDENAQWEIRQYANLVAELVRWKFPRTYELFVGSR